MRDTLIACNFPGHPLKFMVLRCTERKGKIVYELRKPPFFFHEITVNRQSELVFFWQKHQVKDRNTAGNEPVYQRIIFVHKNQHRVTLADDKSISFCHTGPVTGFYCPELGVDQKPPVFNIQYGLKMTDFPGRLNHDLFEYMFGYCRQVYDMLRRRKVLAEEALRYQNAMLDPGVQQMQFLAAQQYALAQQVVATQQQMLAMSQAMLTGFTMYTQAAQQDSMPTTTVEVLPAANAAQTSVVQLSLPKPPGPSTS